MADAIRGKRHTALVQYEDSVGAPTTTATGTYALYSPSGTLANSGGFASFGLGGYGASFDPSIITADGTWRLVYTFATPTAFTRTIYFTAGAPRPGARLVRDLVIEIYRQLRNGRRSTATALGSTTTLVDGRYVFGSANDWLRSEIVMLSGVTGDDERARVVTGFNSASGTFTFAPALTGAVASGREWLLCRYGGRGWEYERVREALAEAASNAGVYQQVADEATYTAGNRDAEYTIPEGWSELTRVQFANPADSATSPRWNDIARANVPRRGDRRRFHLDAAIPYGARLRLEGKQPVLCPPWSPLGNHLDIPADWLIPKVVADLKLDTGEDKDARQATLLIPQLERRRGSVSRGGRA